MQATCIDSTFRRISLSRLALLALFLGGIFRGNAAEHFVTPDGGGLSDGSDWANAFSNVQHAVDAASSGDTVWVTNGVYFSPGPAASDTMIWFGGKGIRLRSVNGPEVTILDGNYPAVTNRVIGWYNASGALLDGFTVRNGYTHSGVAYSGYGAGVYSRGGAGITNCIISGNAGSGQGGGGYVRYHEYVADCVVSNNTSGSYGGLFCLDIGIVTNCSFIGNTVAGNGGGVGLGNTTPLMVDCLVSNNAAGSGGGIYLNSSGITVRNCQVLENTAVSGVGGGIWAWVANAHVENCTFFGNSGASYGGGGVSLRYGGTYASNCWFEANQATSGGGAYLQGDAYLVDCVLTNNVANNNGGGIHIQTTAAVFDCLVVSNTASSGGGVYGSANSLFRNVVIRKNTASNGGGGYFGGAGTLATECLFEDNRAGSGGGLFLRLSGYFDIRNCEFIGNNASLYGGGIYDDSGTSTISNCLFAANAVAGGSQPWGGGLRGPFLVTHCVITNNSASQRGSGIFGAGTLRNSLVAYNEGGGAVHNVGSVENCTVVTNSGYGAYGFLTGYAATNSIFYGNVSGDVACSAQSGVRTVTLGNCFYGTLGSETFNLIQNNCLTGMSPRLEAYEYGNFHLSKASPCINAGTYLTWMDNAMDLVSNPRIAENIVDMGAYEFIRPPPGGTLIRVR